VSCCSGAFQHGGKIDLPTTSSKAFCCARNIPSLVRVSNVSQIQMRMGSQEHEGGVWRVCWKVRAVKVNEGGIQAEGELSLSANKLARLPWVGSKPRQPERGATSSIALLRAFLSGTLTRQCALRSRLSSIFRRGLRSLSIF
jgi:hypothetical protein